MNVFNSDNVLKNVHHENGNRSLCYYVHFDRLYLWVESKAESRKQYFFRLMLILVSLFSSWYNWGICYNLNKWHYSKSSMKLYLFWSACSSYGFQQVLFYLKKNDCLRLIVSRIKTNKMYELQFTLNGKKSTKDINKSCILFENTLLVCTFRLFFFNCSPDRDSPVLLPSPNLESGNDLLCGS